MYQQVIESGKTPGRSFPRFGIVPLTEKIRTDTHSISVHPDFSELDLAKIDGLVVASFCGRHLAAGYFDMPVSAVIIEAGYRGLAIVKKLTTVNYLDKIATDPSMHGTGLGSELFKVVCQVTSDSVAWRAAKTNPANSWYSRLGMQIETPEWFVYLRNIDLEKTANLIDVISTLPRSVV